jgi:hypothetical protein
MRFHVCSVTFSRATSAFAAGCSSKLGEAGKLDVAGKLDAAGGSTT